MEVHGSSMMFYGVLCILFYGSCAQPPSLFGEGSETEASFRLQI